MVAGFGDALWLSMARLTAKGLAFVAGIAVARHLGAELFGEYSIVLAFSLIFSSLADFGMVSLLIRQVAQSSKDSANLVGAALRAQIWVGLAAATLLVVTGFALETNETIRAGLVVMAGGLYLESLGRPFSGGLLGLGRIAQSAIAIAVTSIFNTCEVLMVLVLHGDVLSLLAVALPVGLVAAGIQIALLRRQDVRPVLATGFPTLALLKRSLPFALLAASVVIYDRVDVLMLAHMIGNGAVGVYAAADRILDGLLVIPASIGTALYPAMAANPGMASGRLRSTLMWALPLALFITALSVFPGGYIVDRVYGEDYPGVGNAFQILCVLISLQMATVGFAYLLQARVQTVSAIVATLVGLLVDIASNAVLIPRWEFRGAALSAVIAEFAVLICLVILSRRDESRTWNTKQTRTAEKTMSPAN